MNSYLLADQLLQHALNTLVSFFLFSLLTEASMSIFNIRNFRLRACFRLLPLLKLAFEPLLWLLPIGSNIINANIFSCSHPLQRLLFGSLSDATREQLGLHGLKTVSGSLLLMIPTPLIYAGLVGVLLISTYLLASLVMQYATSITLLKGIRQRGIINTQPIYNQKLFKQLQQRQTEIVVSLEVEIPLAGWSNCIIIPKSLADRLSQNEFEAVLAHELEHHRWGDTILRAISHSIAAIYWWVPVSKWLHKLEQEQELASDSSVHNYELDSIHLATALQKTIIDQQPNRYQCAAFASKATATPGKLLLERLRAVLNPNGIQKQNTGFAVIGTVILLALVPIIGFVIC